MDKCFTNVKMKKAEVMCCFLMLLIVKFSDGSRSAMTNQSTLKVKKLLSSLNKTPVKSITSPDGDIIDCVRLTDQPAFDHPLLKNHKIQTRPSYHPEGFSSDDSKLNRRKGDKKSIAQLWHSNGRCPEGTVPITRTKEEDILRENSVEGFGKKEHRSIPKPKSANPDQINSGTSHEHAIAYIDGGKYYGAKATINVWKPQIQQPDEFSLSQLCILGGSFTQDFNTIQAGWQVFPNLYGDSNPRLFSYWTADAYKSTGCYNLKCPGFVQTNKDIALGARFAPISAYGGSQFDISILVWKDPKGGDWWMSFGKDTLVGYWPASLFTFLADSAIEIQWGGEVVNSQSDGMHTTTEMGSGHFSEEGFGKACYFRDILIVDGSNQLTDPDGLRTFTEKPNCYSVTLGKSDEWRNYLYHGGPGRNPNCS